MADLITQLAEIRRRQGLEPIPDPRQIQGFGDGSDPPPPFPSRDPYPEPQNEPDPYADPDEDPETFRSPLVDAAIPAEPPRTGAPPRTPRTELPKFDLVVLDGNAAYRGTDVALNTSERADVIRVVLRAFQRHASELLVEVQRMMPPPRPSYQPPDDAARVSTLVQPPPKRKRGRPRKVVDPTP